MSRRIFRKTFHVAINLNILLPEWLGFSFRPHAHKITGRKKASSLLGDDSCFSGLFGLLLRLSFAVLYWSLSTALTFELLCVCCVFVCVRAPALVWPSPNDILSSFVYHLLRAQLHTKPARLLQHFWKFSSDGLPKFDAYFHQHGLDTMWWTKNTLNMAAFHFG